MSDFFNVRDRLRALYVAGPVEDVAKEAKGEQLGAGGFLTEVAGRVILTAPASKFTAAEELPKELADRWQEKASGNQHMLWLQGRYVEAEKANRNGAFWSTEDLQFGEMSVKHGPLNWLHEETTVIGTIADNALIHPAAPAQQAMLTNGTLANVTIATASTLSAPMPRPYMAAVSAVWRWVHPERAQAIERANDMGQLWYSMECIAREMSCVSDETHEGCGKSFDYVRAMTQPGSTCEHIANRTSARRLVDPSFLGGAVIVPPTQPGWGSANVEVMRNVASLAEQTYTEAADMSATQWEALMVQVLRFASQ
jgi:hypothetical protein